MRASLLPRRSSQWQGPQPAANLNFVPTAQISLPNGQQIISFDISFVDPVIQLYFLADRTNKSVAVVQTSNNRFQVQLPANPPFTGATGNNDTSGPDGVITVRHQEIWVGDGNSTIKVINLFNRQTTHVITHGGRNRADELCVDPRRQCGPGGEQCRSPFPFVTFISTTTYAVTGKIVMDGTINGGSVLPTPKATNGIEQCQWDQGTGHFFINIPEVNGPGNDSQPGAVLEINPVTHAIVNQYNIPLASCAGPQGMAIGPSSQILLAATRPRTPITQQLSSTSSMAPSWRLSITSRELMRSGSTQGMVYTSWRGQRRSVPLSS